MASEKKKIIINAIKKSQLKVKVYDLYLKSNTLPNYYVKLT